MPIVQYQKERSCCNASAIAISTLTSSSVKAKAFESLNHEHTTLSMLIVHSTNHGACDNISVPQIVAGSFKTANPIDSNSYQLYLLISLFCFSIFFCFYISLHLAVHFFPVHCKTLLPRLLHISSLRIPLKLPFQSISANHFFCISVFYRTQVRS